MANQCMVTINGPVEVRGLRKTCVNIEALNASTFRGSCPCSEKLHIEQLSSAPNKLCIDSKDLCILRCSFENSPPTGVGKLDKRTTSRIEVSFETELNW